MSTNWHAQLADQNWTHSGQWNTAANGSGSSGTPAPGDTCDLNGKIVKVDFATSLGGTITVVDTPGTGLLLFNADITNTDTWVCSCNVRVIGDGSNGYAVNFTNLTVNSLSHSVCNLTVGDGSSGTYLTIGGLFGLGASPTFPLNVTVLPNATLDVSSAMLSGDGTDTLMAVGGSLYAAANDNWVTIGVYPQVEPNATAVFIIDTGGFLVGATPISFAPAGKVALGVDRGDGVPGTRTDCPANKALTTASYGDPSDPITGTLEMSLYVLKSNVVSASQVLVGVATYPGGPAGTFGGLTAAQITQLLTTMDDAAAMAAAGLGS